MKAVARDGRRRLRFSLLSLVLVTALVSLLMARVARRTRLQTQLVVAVQQLQGSVTFGPRRSLGTWLLTPVKGVIGEAYFNEPLMVNLRAKAATDELLARIALHPSVQAIDVMRSQVTDHGVQHLVGMKRLQSLDLSYTRVTCTSTTVLGQLRQLKHLSLAATQIDDSGLATLARLPNLYSLTLANNRISDAGVASISQSRSLERLDLRDTQLTNQGLAYLAKMSRLNHLFLGQTGPDEPGRITGQGLSSLGDCPSLRYLNLHHVPINETLRQHLQSQLPNLTIRAGD